MKPRLIRRSHSQSRSAVSDLLQTAFVGEFLAPSPSLYLYSPWVTDFPVIDNRSGRFNYLDPDWPASQIRLSAVLRALLRRSVQLHLAFRPDHHQDEFQRRLRTAADDDGTSGLIVVRNGTRREHSRGHEKALIAERWALHGSMNFTYSGVEINGELVSFTTDLSDIARLRTEFANEFSEEL